MTDLSGLIKELDKHLALALSSTVKAGIRFENEDDEDDEEAKVLRNKARDHRHNAIRALMNIIDARIEEAVSKLR